MKKELNYITKKGSEIEPKKSEALRYLGISGETKEDMSSLYEECLAEYKAAAQYKCVMDITPISLSENTVDFGFCKIESSALCKNMAGCDRAIVFAATAGIGVDRLLIKYKHLSPAKAMTVSSIASAGIETFCDYINEKVRENYCTKARFSPGYGGVCLSCQKEIFAFLQAEKRLGMSLSESFMMTPVKSVTAFIGIKKIN